VKLALPKKLDKDAWIVIGGAASAVVAVVALSSRGGAKSELGAYGELPYADLPAGSTGDTSDDPGGLFDPILTAPNQTAPSFGDYPAYEAPMTVQRAQPAPIPSIIPASYADRYGNPSTLEQIFAQKFEVASPVYQAPAPASVYRAPTSAPAPVVVSSIPDRFRSLFGLEAIHGAGGARDPFANEYSYMPPSLYQAPIIARSLKAPGGGLAYPAPAAPISGLEAIHGAGGARDPFAAEWAGAGGGGGGGGSW